MENETQKGKTINGSSGKSDENLSSSTAKSEDASKAGQAAEGEISGTVREIVGKDKSTEGLLLKPGAREEKG